MRTKRQRTKLFLKKEKSYYVFKGVDIIVRQSEATNLCVETGKKSQLDSRDHIKIDVTFEVVKEGRGWNILQLRKMTLYALKILNWHCIM